MGGLIVDRRHWWSAFIARMRFDRVALAHLISTRDRGREAARLSCFDRVALAHLISTPSEVGVSTSAIRMHNHLCALKPIDHSAIGLL